MRLEDRPLTPSLPDTRLDPNLLKRRHCTAGKFIGNVNEPYIPKPDDPKSLGIDVEHDYKIMLETICKA